MSLDPLGNGSTAEPPSAPYDLLSTPPEMVVPLLAQGLVNQFQRLLDNRTILLQSPDVLDPLLIAASAKLSSIYMVEGGEDRAASIHAVMKLSTLPIRKWGIRRFTENSEFPYLNLILVDPETRVPTQEARELARQYGQGENQILEDHYHRQLRETVKQSNSPDGHYSAIRHFVVSHAVTDRATLAGFFREVDFPTGEGLVNGFYRLIPEIWVHQGKLVHICTRCSGLLRPHWDRDIYPDGVCLTRHCRNKGPTKACAQVAHGPHLRLAQPQLLEYWVGPGIDERLIYGVAKASGRNPLIYPLGDACDVSLDGTTDIGIDAKSYSSPLLLIKRLNQSIGRLNLFKRKIVAIGDEFNQLDGVYLRTLNAQKAGEAAGLEFMSVSQLCGLIQKGEI